MGMFACVARRWQQVDNPKSWTAMLCTCGSCRGTNAKNGNKQEGSSSLLKDGVAFFDWITVFFPYHILKTVVSPELLELSNISISLDIQPQISRQPTLLHTPKMATSTLNPYRSPAMGSNQRTLLPTHIHTSLLPPRPTNTPTIAILASLLILTIGLTAINTIFTSPALPSFLLKHAFYSPLGIGIIQYLLAIAVCLLTLASILCCIKIFSKLERSRSGSGRSSGNRTYRTHRGHSHRNLLGSIRGDLRDEHERDLERDLEANLPPMPRRQSQSLGIGRSMPGNDMTMDGQDERGGGAGGGAGGGSGNGGTPPHQDNYMGMGMYWDWYRGFIVEDFDASSYTLLDEYDDVFYGFSGFRSGSARDDVRLGQTRNGNGNGKGEGGSFGRTRLDNEIRGAEGGTSASGLGSRSKSKSNLEEGKGSQDGHRMVEDGEDCEPEVPASPAATIGLEQGERVPLMGPEGMGMRYT
ncbi:hypothetical protein B0T20DRAFT_427551 [Sordaria brevicollis]|uniref:Uncharacterized protein n=1 Tax=Sordaria brevicollis TaxID=83679 RepID=A0AAE0NRF9_SORBR|nr:hypothetical protein B0T20DRAFT_427551 [Sordaria brevicollis]